MVAGSEAGTGASSAGARPTSSILVSMIIGGVFSFRGREDVDDGSSEASRLYKGVYEVSRAGEIRRYVKLKFFEMLEKRQKTKDERQETTETDLDRLRSHLCSRSRSRLRLRLRLRCLGSRCLVSSRLFW